METEPLTAPPVDSLPAQPSSDRKAQRFDFRHPVFLSSGEWRKLRIELTEFVESLGALLSTYFRLDFGLQLGKLHTLSFNEFTQTLASSTEVSLFKLEPFRGISLIEVPLALASAIVDRLLGGPGKPSGADRALTDMEVALLDQFVQIVLNEWCKQWRPIQELRGDILGHENNPKFLQTSSGDTTLLVLTLETRLGECADKIQLAFPYQTVEPLVQKLTQTSAASAQPASTDPLPAAAPPLKWKETLGALSLTLNADLPQTKIPTRRLLDLKPGQVLELNPESVGMVEVRIGKVVKFKGALGRRSGTWAVKITELLKSA